MASFHRAIYRIAEFLRWHEMGELILQPKFQRRRVWEDVARSYLIDTVVRNLPMPKIYLRRIADSKKRHMVYEVVDGQQRLSAIIDFHNGDLKLQEDHNPEFGGLVFDGLPDPVQRAFLDYEISTDVMEDASDPEVFKMFERLNQYTLTLNKQEKLNAEYFGYFKQTAYGLASEQLSLDAWRNMRIFSNRLIARMSEVEFTSDVLVAILEGICDIINIPTAYHKYDKQFTRRSDVTDAFRSALTLVATNFPETVRTTKFRNRTWFYSLIVALADATVGIPNGEGVRALRPMNIIQQRMADISTLLSSEQPPHGVAALIDAFSKGTSHIPQRRVRHEYFYAMLTLSEDSWHKKWAEMTSSGPST
jgi:hypothetical protein